MGRRSKKCATRAPHCCTCTCSHPSLTIRCAPELLVGALEQARVYLVRPHLPARQLLGEHEVAVHGAHLHVKQVALSVMARTLFLQV